MPQFFLLLSLLSRTKTDCQQCSSVRAATIAAFTISRAANIIKCSNLGYLGLFANRADAIEVEPEATDIQGIVNPVRVFREVKTLVGI